ncbi:DUF1772 domain-containing protein [Alkalinema pantanalense CENA528]|uniref:anthrone oxygenase family protein n=1 Tax=Alkalinema pantanalense TaxID=1620705 RepID=UPI003D6ECF34
MAPTYSVGFGLKLGAILGCGLVAGVFFAFSTFVMPALARLQPSQGIAAMQSINITATTPLFMLALFGTAGICLALTIGVFLKWPYSDSTYLLLGSALYLLGSIGVTIAFNVPLNDSLATVKPESPEGTLFWARYLTEWTFWNHVRTIASLVATLLFSLTL